METYLQVPASSKPDFYRSLDVSTPLPYAQHDGRTPFRQVPNALLSPTAAVHDNACDTPDKSSVVESIRIPNRWAVPLRLRCTPEFPVRCTLRSQRQQSCAAQEAPSPEQTAPRDQTISRSFSRSIHSAGDDIRSSFRSRLNEWSGNDLAERFVREMGLPCNPGHRESTGACNRTPESRHDFLFRAGAGTLAVLVVVEAVNMLVCANWYAEFGSTLSTTALFALDAVAITELATKSASAKGR